MKGIIEQMFKINYNTKLKEILVNLKGEKQLTQVQILRNEWFPQLFAKYDQIYEMLTVQEYKDALDLIKEKWMKQEIYDYIDALSYETHQMDLEDHIVCHNDIQEQNILAIRRNATDLKLIDYEYSSLGNREFDLANTFCELMMDNDYPYFPYVGLYPENCLEEDEFEAYSRYYLELYYTNYYQGDMSKEEYINSEIKQFLENLYTSMILDGFYWGVWSILMIKEDEINNKIFNFAFALKRIELTKILESKPFIRTAIDNKLKRYKEAKASEEHK